jgi:hypothetical protein
MAHTIQFDGDVCNGQLNINPAFLSVSEGGFGFSGKYTHNQSAKNGINSHKPMGCKSNVLRCFLADTTSSSINLTWVVSADQDDLELMQLADHAFAVGAIAPDLQSMSYIERVESFEQLITKIPINN